MHVTFDIRKLFPDINRFTCIANFYSRYSQNRIKHLRTESFPFMEDKAKQNAIYFYMKTFKDNLLYRIVRCMAEEELTISSQSPCQTRLYFKT